MNHHATLYHQPFKEIYTPVSMQHPQAGVISNAGFSMVPLESVLPPVSWTLYERTHPSMFTLIVFTHGTGRLNIDLCDYDIQRGTALILYPGAALRVNMNEECRGHCISFSPDLFTRADSTSVPLLFNLLHHNLLRPVVVHTDEGMQQDLLLLLQSMQQEYTTCKKGHTEIFRELLRVLMTYLSRAMDPVPYPFFYEKSMVVPERFMALIRKHICTHKQVAGYAAMLCVTPGFLNSVMKRATGHTASYHIYQHLLLEAKRKAVFSTCSMKDIAAALGFTDVYHFSKFFRKNAGINFSSFRKESGYAGYDKVDS